MDDFNVSVLEDTIACEHTGDVGAANTAQTAATYNASRSRIVDTFKFLPNSHSVLIESNSEECAVSASSLRNREGSRVNMID